jgi:hypothetical protein
MLKSPLPSYSGGRPILSPYSRWKKGKRNASVDKMDYTLYLSQCSKSCSQLLTNARLVGMSDSTSVPEQSDVHNDLEQWRSIIREDIEHLTGLLTELDTAIQGLRTMVRY